MEKISTSDQLRATILRMESKQVDQVIQLREQFNLAYESLKPINLIKSVFTEATGSSEIKDNLLNTSFGLTAGYLSKLLVEVVMKSPLNKFIGTAIMFGIKNVISKNPEVVKSLGKTVFNIFRNKTNAPDDDPEQDESSKNAI